MQNRDDFTPTVKDTLARRVGFRCSNPNCRKITAGPREDPRKIVNIGVAAHITAAAPGGPRYDPLLSPDGRASEENGIWLCQNCAKLIDNDPDHYIVDALRLWKTRAEETARAELEGRARFDPAYTGILVPRAELLFSPSGGGRIPLVEIGRSGQVLGPEGVPGVHPIYNHQI